MPIFGFISIIITSKSLIRISLCYLCKCVCVVRGNGIWWLSSMFVSFANGMERKCGKSCLWIKMRKSNGTYGREGGININPIICQKKKNGFGFLSSSSFRFLSYQSVPHPHIIQYDMIFPHAVGSGIKCNRHFITVENMYPSTFFILFIFPAQHRNASLISLGTSGCRHFIVWYARFLGSTHIITSVLSCHMQTCREGRKQCALLLRELGSADSPENKIVYIYISISVKWHPTSER